MIPVLLAALVAGAVPADEGAHPAISETIQVTATRLPEAVDPEPAAITVVTGDELRQTGATDLAGALASVGGVAAVPGGDGGPAASVPELWGLREFDAFLLVVDDVPWGGAFNPALASVDLTEVDRIEVLRGPAPVMYGATSFVGVIHVIHRQAGEGAPAYRVWGGSYSTGGASVYVPLRKGGRFRHSLTANAERLGVADDDAGAERGHLLYRGRAETAGGVFRIDFDATLLDQDPASPHPREGAVLSPRVPVDANHNPGHAMLDEDRYHLVVGYGHEIGGGEWSTTLALTRVARDVVRGFLSELSNGSDPNAAGFRQDQEETNVYLDTHFGFRPAANVGFLFGADWLYGKGESEGENFDYHVRLDGSGAPSISAPEVQERVDLEDERNFSGLYAQVEWTPAERWLVQVGARLNRTDEDRKAEVEPAAEDEGEEGAGKDSRTETRGSGTAGVSFRAWADGADSFWIFADYRDAFKPAAIDFGPEGEGGILDAETGASYEVGLKGHNLDGRFDWQVSAFRMDLEDLVTSTVVDGLPSLINSGTERFEGIDMEVGHLVRPDLRWQLAYGLHSSEFRDFVQSFDGVPTQLAGNKLEMSPANQGAIGLVYFPDHGFSASAVVDFVGDRFLTKRNTAKAESYTTWSAGVGYRFRAGELRLDGHNLNDTRPPVAESELGDAQYYLLPARSIVLGYRGSWGD